MEIDVSKVFFKFESACECEGQEKQDNVTMADIMEVGIPCCSECGAEFDLCNTCEVRNA